MARYIVDGTATVVGTALRPIVSVYNTAAVNARLREVHLFNTTATGGFVLALCRLTAATNAGAGLTEVALDSSGVAATCTATAGHTGDGTLTHLGPSKVMGAAIGDGVIWTFNNDVGVTAPLGTANGIGVYVPSGTGQICRYSLIWDE